MSTSIHDLIRELTQPTTHQEPYWITLVGRTHYHTTTHPPLITQLDESAIPSYTQVDGAGKVATSRPAASVDAIDTATHIRTSAATWLADLGHDTTGTTIDVVRRLGSLIPTQPHCGHPRPTFDQHRNVTCCTTHRIETDIRRWWIQARTITGWDQPAWQPDNTCPLCGTRGTLRIRLLDRVASCIEDNCRQTWDNTTIGLLADHIRTENHEPGV